MSKKGRNQPDQRADTRGGRFVGLPHAVIESAAYRHVSPFARAVLIEVLARFNGYNNGAIGISQREIAAALATTNFGRIGRGIAELIAAGLLDVSTEGAWKERAAREYRLTFVSTGKPPHAKAATNDYLGWRAQSGDEHPSAGSPQSAEHPSAGLRKSAEHLSARVAGKGRKTVSRPKPAAEHPSSLIGKPYPSPTERVGLPSRSHTLDGAGPAARPPADAVSALRAALEQLVAERGHAILHVLGRRGGVCGDWLFGWFHDRASEQSDDPDDRMSRETLEDVQWALDHLPAQAPHP